ncbi:unnamed protein product [Arctia plantaginis]|uniref:Uncharacterized protein n=1 Tax=Arctia plantaginis TaxID=874455 RepID=A0A8S1A299_ARCPL|nr:unnamed protein product [Arctia plantaginis]
MCDRLGVINKLQSVMSSIQGCGCAPPPPCCARPCCSPCCGGGGSLVTVYNAVLAVGQPPVPIAAFDEAVIAVGQCGKS